MSLFAIGAWVILGAVAAGALVTFWDNIAGWLNNVAANVVEEVFGYSARNKMQRAVAKVDRVMDKIRNRSTIFVKENRLDTHYLKTEIEAEADVYDIDSKVIDEIRNKKELVQEFEYKM